MDNNKIQVKIQLKMLIFWGGIFFSACRNLPSDADKCCILIYSDSSAVHSCISFFDIDFGEPMRAIYGSSQDGSNYDNANSESITLLRLKGYSRIFLKLSLYYYFPNTYEGEQSLLQMKERHHKYKDEVVSITEDKDYCFLVDTLAGGFVLFLYGESSYHLDKEYRGIYYVKSLSDNSVINIYMDSDKRHYHERDSQQFVRFLQSLEYNIERCNHCRQCYPAYTE